MRYIKEKELQRVLSSVNADNGYLCVDKIIAGLNSAQITQISSINGDIDDIIVRLEKVVGSWEKPKPRIPTSLLANMYIASRPTITKWIKNMRAIGYPTYNFRIRGVDIDALKLFLQRIKLDKEC